MGRRLYYSSCEEVNEAVSRLVKLGWQFEKGRVHGKLKSPDGKLVTSVPRTPSDHRAGLNWVCAARRRGIPI